MKKDNEEIIVNLDSKEESASVRKLSKEEQEQILKLQEEIKETLTKEEKEKRLAEHKSMSDDIDIDEVFTDNYEKFFKQYSKRDEPDSGSAGKYNSDLDFKLNRKMRKVHLPLPKKIKALVWSLTAIGVIMIGVALGFVLYKPPAQVTLTSVAISQQKNIRGQYLVDNVYVGDKLSYDNIYLICTYSDGSVKKVPITQDMVTKVSGKVNARGQFTNGDVVSTINYNGFVNQILFTVDSRVPTEMIISQVDNIYTTKREGSNVYIDFNNQLIVNVKYSDGTIKKVDLNKCRCRLLERLSNISDGVAVFTSCPTGEFQVRMYYEEQYLNESGEEQTYTVSTTFFITNNL